MWVSLAALAVSEAIHNEDVVETVVVVRHALADPPPLLDAAGVRVAADPDWGRLEVRLPHTDGTVAEFSHGDGYTAIVTPVAEYHGWVEDTRVPHVLAALLHGRVAEVRWRIARRRTVRRGFALHDRDGCVLVSSDGAREHLLSAVGVTPREARSFSFAPPI